jgi:thiosulfate dehydrogenase (quinone) large subunit
MSQGGRSVAHDPRPPVDPRPIALALLRVTLGTLLLFAGVGKITEGREEFVPGFVERFEETWLPDALVTVVAHALPYLEVGLGVLLVLGLFTLPALFGAAVLFLVFTFGTTVADDHEATGRNTLYALITFVLIWLSSHDRLGLDRLRGPGSP